MIVRCPDDASLRFGRLHEQRYGAADGASSGPFRDPVPIL
jgi:hypothetical protein